MAYDPSREPLATPTEAGELYLAIRDLAVAQGEWTLGNPDQQPAADPDQLTYRQESFFGFAGIVVGDICEVGELPVASYPPTHRLTIAGEEELALLRELVPDAREVLGVGRGGVQLLHHETYIRHMGGKGRVDPEAKPQNSDSALLLNGPANPDLMRRTFRLVPLLGEPGARGLRTDIHAQLGPLRDPDTHLFPDMRRGEADCLMRLLRAAASIATAAEHSEPEHKPQQEE
jgi:hypothetical protein